VKLISYRSIAANFYPKERRSFAPENDQTDVCIIEGCRGDTASKDISLNTLNVGYENTIPIDLHYEDIGDGKPAILVHGWPIDSILWTNQARALRKAGLRVISYDRRGFGKSSRPSGGYDYDTLADDLHHIVSTLDLHDVTLVGFTSGCGEIFRYLGTYGSERICKSAFVSPLPPSPQKSIANPIVNFTEELDSLRQTQITEALDAIQSFTQNFLEELESNTSQTGEIFLQFISRTMHSISLAMDIIDPASLNLN